MDHLHGRHVVLGAGAMGSAAAYHLARRGEPVILVEQFQLGHDRGSSHGAARITRHSYADLRYARLMPEAFRAWRDLEADAGRCLYVRTGGLSLSPPGVDYVGQVARSLAALEVPHRMLTGAGVRKVYPQFAVDVNVEAVFEPDAGLLAADTALALEVSLARQLGGERTVVLERCPVRRIDLDGGRPTLICDERRITADRLIVTAGAWIGKLFPALAARLSPMRQCVGYFRPPDEREFAIGSFPVFIWKGAEPLDAWYGLPEYLGGGVKVARHGGPDCDPDEVDRGLHEENITAIREFLASAIPALARAPLVSAEICLYTVEPSDEFVVGAWPGRPDVFIASPCSGHGFKFSCLVGRVLADLAQHGETAVDTSGWRGPGTL
jgi:sarcosine oxidase